MPEELTCPITRTMFRDPVMVVDSGHTYERIAILSHFERNGAKDPFTNCALSDTRVVTNWAVRQIVQAWLDSHPGVTPDGWDSRALLDPHEVLPQFKFATQLHILRGLSPTLRNRWSFNERPEDWSGVELENGQVVGLDLESIGTQTAAFWAQLKSFPSLKELDLNNNELTSLSAEIGQLTSLESLYLSRNQLTSLPAEIGQLTSLTELHLSGNRLTTVPYEIGLITSLVRLDLTNNKLTSMPAAIWNKCADDCHLDVDNDVGLDDDPLTWPIT